MPTQAQIEAAAMALYQNAGAPTETLAKAALAAAAEVGEQETTMEHIARDIKEGRFPRKSEVQNRKWLDPKCGIDGCQSLAVEAATIERCARVAESFADGESIEDVGLIAAAIRAMKD